MNTPPSPSVRRLLLPSIAAAGLVFSLSLTVLSVYKSEWFERVAKVGAEDSQRDYALTNRGRDTAIRVVGTAIVLSVATGILTVEGLRKWYAFRDRVSEKADALGLTPLLDPEFEVSEFEVPEFETPEFAATLEPSLASNPLELNWGDGEPISEFIPEPIPPLIPQSIALDPGTYSIDRQVLPGTLHRQLVLHYAGQDYRFLRTAETVELLQRYCDVLNRSLRSIVVTPLVAESETGFGIWEQVPVLN